MPPPNERWAARENPASASTARSSSGWVTSFASRSTSTGVVSPDMRGTAEAGNNRARGRHGCGGVARNGIGGARRRQQEHDAPRPRQSVSSASRSPASVCALPPAAVERMIRAITGARDIGGGESGMVEKRFRQLDRQAGLPAVRRLHGDGREHGGRARRVPRRRDALRRHAGSAPGRDPADRAGARRSAGLRLVRLRQRRLLPQGREEVPVGPVREGDRRHARVRPLRERRHRLHEGRRGRALRRRPPVRVPVQGLGRPRGAAALGHVADLELLSAEPEAHGSGPVRRPAVLRAARLGLHRAAREPRPRRRQRRDVRRAVRRALQGQDRLGRHAQHDGRRRLRPRHRRTRGT